jgi:hypothetical protein
VAVAHVADEDREPAHPRERHPPPPPPATLLAGKEPPDLRAAARDLAAARGAKPCPGRGAPERIGARRRRRPAAGDRWRRRV